MTGFWHRVLAGLLLGQVPILKRSSLHGMPDQAGLCVAGEPLLMLVTAV